MKNKAGEAQLEKLAEPNLSLSVGNNQISCCVEGSANFLPPRPLGFLSNLWCIVAYLFCIKPEGFLGGKA